ncbi:hypothetical protein [Azohydromonas caseinilytica]|uniref:Uncharacterized protein n=1 Tax=Azohydromonas caseinilytica TaxID=2728836 RepID=A0A848FE03_9BURK|nr:hypothetical protein [Azohydromonas caseinilytica]NML16513.1 hypothetical protein [Azohydromonas caseinilytica]
MSAPNGSRRDFVKKGVYVAPAILTLAAAPEFAKAGSVKPAPPKNGGGRGHDHPGRGDDRPGRGNDRPGRGGKEDRPRKNWFSRD